MEYVCIFNSNIARKFLSRVHLMKDHRKLIYIFVASYGTRVLLICVNFIITQMLTTWSRPYICCHIRATQNEICILKKCPSPIHWIEVFCLVLDSRLAELVHYILQVVLGLTYSMPTALYTMLLGNEYIQRIKTNCHSYISEYWKINCCAEHIYSASTVFARRRVTDLFPPFSPFLVPFLVLIDLLCGPFPVMNTQNLYCMYLNRKASLP